MSLILPTRRGASAEAEIQAPALSTTRLQRWLTAPTLIYLLVVILVPVSANLSKLVLAALAVAGALLLFVVRQAWPIHRAVFNVAFFSLSVGAAWLLYGLWAGNPGAEFSLMIYLIWPLFYIFTLTSAIQTFGVYRLIRRLMVGSLIGLGLFVLYFVGYSFGIFPATPLLNLPLGQGISIQGGVTALRLYAISSLIFLVPYAVSKLVYHPNGSRIAAFVAAVVLGIIATLLAGRRAAVLTMALAPFILFLLLRYAPALERLRIRRNLWLTALIAAPLLTGTLLASNINLAPATYISYVQSAFDPSSEDDALVRVEQAEALWDGWGRNLKTILVGEGLGATAGYVRSERGWNFELQYNLHLFHMGILGVLLYGAGIAWIYWQGVAIIRRGGEHASEMVALLAGMTCFLAANATNPYLQAYGQLWTLFLPVAYINLVKLRQAT